MYEAIESLLKNQILICGVCAWAVAQILKTIIYALVHHEIRWERLFGDGQRHGGRHRIRIRPGNL